MLVIWTKSKAPNYKMERKVEIRAQSLRQVNMRCNIQHLNNNISIQTYEVSRVRIVSSTVSTIVKYSPVIIFLPWRSLPADVGAFASSVKNR